MSRIKMALEPLASSDATSLLALWADFDVIKYTNWNALGTEQEVVARIERIHTRYHPGSGRVGPFVIRSEDGDFIGLIGLDVHEDTGDDLELWYLIKRMSWGRGFASRAVALVLEAIAGGRRVVATAVVENQASWRLLERNGFRRVERIPGGFTRNGLCHDLYRYERELRT